MISVKRKVTFVRRPDHTDALIVSESAPRLVAARVPRIARLMALAIYFEQRVRDGRVRDFSELARLVHASQPRMTQILNLNHLAPDIQEELLYLQAAERGRERIHERLLRPIVAQPSWNRQRDMWKRIKLAYLAEQAGG